MSAAFLRKGNRHMRKKEFSQMTYNDRLRLDTLIRAGHKPKEVAEILHKHISTIYRELKRGRYIHTNSDLTEEERYNPEEADRKARENLKAKGAGLKIGNDIELANFLESLVIERKYSPDAALAKAREEQERFTTMICTTTFYSYIDKGIFLKLTNKDLPVKKDKKRKYRKVKQLRSSKGESIENRPEKIDTREEMGHWEMDTVKGKQGVTKSCLLVLTERKTRNEIIAKLPDQKAESVVNALNRLEKKLGSMFYNVFKSITVDNGSEFADYEGMEKSCRRKGKRTTLYYCHPYSSYERGSNENQNKMIRRHIPKGTNLDAIPNKRIKQIENWINDYPRRKLGYCSSKELFEKELIAI